MGRRRPPSRAETCAPAAPPEPPLLLTPEQAFAAVQVGRTRGWKMIRDGTLPSVRLSPRIVRVPRQALEALIAAGGVQGARATAAQEGRAPVRLHAGRPPCAAEGRPDAQDKGASPSKPAPRDLDLHNPDQRHVSCPPQG